MKFNCECGRSQYGDMDIVMMICYTCQNAMKKEEVKKVGEQRIIAE